MWKWSDASAGAAVVAGPDRVVVVGLGNIHRHDDGAGPVVASCLAAGGRAGPDTVRYATVRYAVADVTHLLDAWDGADLAVVVDATRTGQEPGTVAVSARLGGDGPPRAGRRALGGVSSHSIDLGDALGLARAVGAAPRSLVVVGVEGRDFGPGEGLSRAVEDAVPSAVRAVRRAIAEYRSTSTRA